MPSYKMTIPETMSAIGALRACAGLFSEILEERRAELSHASVAHELRQLGALVDECLPAGEQANPGEPSDAAGISRYNLTIPATMPAIGTIRAVASELARLAAIVDGWLRAGEIPNRQKAQPSSAAPPPSDVGGYRPTMPPGLRVQDLRPPSGGPAIEPPRIRNADEEFDHLLHGGLSAAPPVVRLGPGGDFTRDWPPDATSGNGEPRAGPSSLLSLEPEWQNT